MRRARCARCKKPAGEPFIKLTWAVESNVIGTCDEDEYVLCLPCNQFVAEAIRGALKMPRKQKAVPV